MSYSLVEWCRSNPTHVRDDHNSGYGRLVCIYLGHGRQGRTHSADAAIDLLLTGAVGTRERSRTLTDALP